MADFLQAKRREIEQRLKQLQPVVDEFNELTKAAAALGSVGRDGAGTAGSSAGRTSRTRGRRRSTRAAAGSSGTRARTATRGTSRARSTRTGARRGRPRGSGTRALQALELVRSSPGITIPELAQKMGIKQNYLYRVLPGLQQDGKVRKQGRGWHPKAS